MVPVLFSHVLSLKNAHSWEMSSKTPPLPTTLKEKEKSSQGYLEQDTSNVLGHCPQEVISLHTVSGEACETGATFS